jgi:tetratricopeptide (TPR) repeat protein
LTADRTVVTLSWKGIDSTWRNFAVAAGLNRMSTGTGTNPTGIADKRVAFVGKLGGVNRREGQQLVRQHGGVPLPRCDATADIIVIGADVFPLDEEETLLDESVQLAAAEGRAEIISETEFWQRLGLMENEQSVRKLYTPAMLAELLNVSIATIRRWHRLGLIQPTREVHRLPYFDFQEVSTARRLAQLIATGGSAQSIEKKLANLSRFLPNVDRPLAQLSVIVEGKQILLRHGEGLIEPGGQLRIDFGALESRTEPAAEAATVSLADYLAEQRQCSTPEEMLRAAAMLEDEGELKAAAEMYRAALAGGGVNAQTCFQLAELLYRIGDVAAARERYFMTIELDEDFVEARANLGCVLAETGELELAVAAFQGTLSYHRDYPDVHYHLARTLDQLGRADEANQYWHAFLQLAPDSPWADEARGRLNISG